MKIYAVAACLFFAFFRANAQEDLFLVPLGKSFGEYRDRINCVVYGYEFGDSYTDKSTCNSYRLNAPDSFRVGKIIFYTLFFHRDTGRTINNLSFNKTITGDKRSQQVKRANEEFQLLSEWLDKYCGSPGVVRHSIPRIKNQKYRYKDWNKGPLKFTLQQVDVKTGKGFSTLDLWIEKKGSPKL